MGRQTEKSKLKQARLKEEKKQLNSALVLVKKANELADPLEACTAFKSYKNGSLDVYLECKRVTQLNEETVDKLVDLMRANMMNYYAKSSWGWDEKKKREEMTEDAAWYLIARDTSGRMVGFSHFRFDIDCKQNVLYLYELQLDESARRQKLGQFMLRALEMMAFINSMRKVVLTVLKNNEGALEFFSKCGYTLDETNPEDSFEEQFCYYIFSKLNKKQL